jgi:hypothetical protein
VCRLIDTARQIRALDDALAATKPAREGSARTVSEARRALDAGRREQQCAPRVQCRLRRATGQHQSPTACSREPINCEVATAAAAAAASVGAAAECVTPVTLSKSRPSVSRRSGSFQFGLCRLKR